MPHARSPEVSEINNVCDGLQFSQFSQYLHLEETFDELSLLHAGQS
jgi:hypothetical protein